MALTPSTQSIHFKLAGRTRTTLAPKMTASFELSLTTTRLAAGEPSFTTAWPTTSSHVQVLVVLGAFEIERTVGFQPRSETLSVGEFFVCGGKTNRKPGRRNHSRRPALWPGLVCFQTLRNSPRQHSGDCEEVGSAREFPKIRPRLAQDAKY